MTETFYISVKFIVVFHVNMLQQLQIPVSSINDKHEKIPSMIFFGCYDQFYTNEVPLSLFSQLFNLCFQISKIIININMSKRQAN